MNLATDPDTQYAGQKMKGLQMSGQIIIEKEFEKCTFEKCNLLECSFIRCKFIDCIFVDSMVSAVKFKNCVILNVTFRNSKVMGIDWSLAEKTRQLQFEDCVVSLTNLTFVRYADLRMLNCQAREVSFMDADCSGASFVGTDFEKCIFLRTNLTGADFRKARNYSIDISNSIIKKAIFSFPEAVSLLSGMDIILED